MKSPKPNSLEPIIQTASSVKGNTKESDTKSRVQVLALGPDKGGIKREMEGGSCTGEGGRSGLKGESESEN